MTELRVVLCNCSKTEAPGLAKALVKERLAACVNVIEGVTSFFWWDGELCEDSESTLVIKTTVQRWEALKARLNELHSYDTPEIVALEAVDVIDGYLNWVKEQTQ